MTTTISAAQGTSTAAPSTETETTLPQNLELYRDLKRDGKVFSSLQKRTGALVGRPWAVEPVREENSSDAETLTTILKLFNFDQLCRDLLDAILMGFSVSEIVWTVQDGYVIPARIPKRRQRRFAYVQSDQDEGPVLRLLTKENMLTGVALPEKKFIVHRMNPEDDNPYGTGLGLQLYWPVFFKRKGIVSWAKLCDRFGSPTPWGKYPRNAGPKEKATLADALRAFSNDGFVMTPDGATIELLESKLSGNITTQEALVNAMNDWIAEVLLGQEPRATGGGALAAASKERTSVRLDLVQADSDLLSETLNRSLIAWLCEFNGLAPCVVYRQIKEEEDKKAESETDKEAAHFGASADQPPVAPPTADALVGETQAEPPLQNGDRVESLHTGRPGRVVRTYADGSACICWDGDPQPEGLGHERMPRQLLIRISQPSTGAEAGATAPFSGNIDPGKGQPTAENESSTDENIENLPSVFSMVGGEFDGMNITLLLYLGKTWMVAEEIAAVLAQTPEERTQIDTLIAGHFDKKNSLGSYAKVRFASLPAAVRILDTEAIHLLDVVLDTPASNELSAWMREISNYDKALVEQIAPVEVESPAPLNTCATLAQRFDQLETMHQMVFDILDRVVNQIRALRFLADNNSKSIDIGRIAEIAEEQIGDYNELADDMYSIFEEIKRRVFKLPEPGMVMPESHAPNQHREASFQH